MKSVLIMLSLLGSAAAGESDGLLLTDFDSRKLSFVTVNDNVMGGRSEGGFRIDGGTLVFSGSTNTNGGGFSSIRSETRDLGLTGREGVTLRVRGDGRTYTFRLAVRGTRASFWSDFETVDGKWMEVRLPFDSFVPRWRGRRLDLPAVDPAKIVGVGLMINDERDGPFRLEVDWIRAHDPFSLAALRWEKRPLVVFAPRADDASLLRQLEAVRSSPEGFEERHMALIVVAPGLGLSKAERRDLRERLGVEEGSFAVRLVGKDGKVKRRSAEPVPMSEIFELIDGMPMRREEMKERDGK